MRKFWCFCALLILILSFSSCEKNIRKINEGSETPYIIFSIDNQLVKINCQTGLKTTLCQDPLCNHSEMYRWQCPFYCDVGKFTLTESGNTLYFARTIDQNQIFQYNLKTGDLKEIYKTNQTVLDIIAYKEDLYFIERIYEANDIEEFAYYNLHKYASAEDRVVKLNQEKIENLFVINSIKNDRIYIFDFGSNSGFNTALDFTDRKTTNSDDFSSKYDYEYIKDEKTGWRTIKSVKDDKGNRKIITERAGWSAEVNEYIYYVEFLDEEKFIAEDKVLNKKYYNRGGSIIYRAKYDGSENGILCDFGEHINPHFLSLYNYKPAAGDYYLVEFDKYETTETEQVYIAHEYAVLNIITGEYKMVT